MYAALTLRPRARWDEERPEGATARDWHPWRFNRKLSLVRRPFKQLDEGRDPSVLVFPALLERAVRRFTGLVDGRLPAVVFDSPEMAVWIGRAVDRPGHASNRHLAERLADLGWSTFAEVALTRLGGDASLGDVYVLAWCPATGRVWRSSASAC